MIQKCFQVCLLPVKNTLFKQIWKFAQNSGKEFMTFGTTEARPTQKEKLPGRAELSLERTACLYGILIYTVMPLNNLLNELCCSTRPHFILVRVWHQSLSSLWLLPLIPGGFPWRTWISAVQLVQTGEVNWTPEGDWGWKGLLPLENVVLEKNKANLFTVLRAAS